MERDAPQIEDKKLDCFICGILRPSNIIIRHKFIQNTVTICPHHTHLFSFISSSINQENLIIAQKIYRLLRYCVTHPAILSICWIEVQSIILC